MRSFLAVGNLNQWHPISTCTQTSLASAASTILRPTSICMHFVPSDSSNVDPKRTESSHSLPLSSKSMSSARCSTNQTSTTKQSTAVTASSPRRQIWLCHEFPNDLCWNTHNVRWRARAASSSLHRICTRNARGPHSTTTMDCSRHEK